MKWQRVATAPWRDVCCAFGFEHGKKSQSERTPRRNHRSISTLLNSSLLSSLPSILACCFWPLALPRLLPGWLVFGCLALDMETQSIVATTLTVGMLSILSLSATCDKSCKVCYLKKLSINQPKAQSG